MAAETLAMVAGVEEANFVNTWIAELRFPKRGPLELAALGNDSLLPLDVAMDCEDLYSALLSPAPGMPTDRTLQLYLMSLRLDREKGYVRDLLWVDTDDQLANAGTKLSGGFLPSGTLPEALR
eukprot:2320735-Alexandrium_andersonii.AAC.1